MVDFRRIISYNKNVARSPPQRLATFGLNARHTEMCVLFFYIKKKAVHYCTTFPHKRIRIQI
nr:MAG TPA: hypothetical protein [Caudoviricetes sp.]